jgi:hypothetical protein
VRHILPHLHALQAGAQPAPPCAARRFAQDGTMHEAVEMVIEGEGFGDGFARLIADKAARLSLRLLAAEHGTRRIRLRLGGHPELIDMLSVACLLGPREARVDRVTVAS